MEREGKGEGGRKGRWRGRGREGGREGERERGQSWDTCIHGQVVGPYLCLILQDRNLLLWCRAKLTTHC